MYKTMLVVLQLMKDTDEDKVLLFFHREGQENHKDKPETTQYLPTNGKVNKMCYIRTMKQNLAPIKK